MDKQIDIFAELCEDEVVRYLADRYHTTPMKVLQSFLAQDKRASESEECPAEFSLEDNEMEILRGLTHCADPFTESQINK